MYILKHIKSPVNSFRRKVTIWSTLICILCFLSNCSQKDDLVLEKDEVPEGMTRISLIVPDYDANEFWTGSRAYDELGEANMSNLYVVAVKYYNLNDDGTQGEECNPHEVYSTALNPEGDIYKLGDKNYKRYSFTLYPGKYKFGVVANVDRYLVRNDHRISNFTDETDLNNITLNFTEETPLAPLHLPMACLPPDIRYKQGTVNSNGNITWTEEQKGDGTDNLITIKKSDNKIICAEMTFLCSKVRYTILFDKTPGGISEAFGSSWIRFNVDDQEKPIATNLRKQTKLFQNSKGNNYDKESPFISGSNPLNQSDESDLNEVEGYAEASVGSWNIPIGRYYWDDKEEWDDLEEDEKVGNEGEGADYPKSPSSELRRWNGTTADWINRERKVWQGVVYLPENDTTAFAKTILEFPYHTRANSLDETPEIRASEPKKIYLFGNPKESHYGGTTSNSEYSTSEMEKCSGLVRNYMYDVVARVREPDIDEMDIRVFVSIIPWHEINQSISDSYGGDTTEPDPNSFKDKVNDWSDGGSYNW